MCLLQREYYPQVVIDDLEDGFLSMQNPDDAKSNFNTIIFNEV
jgi:hypothetical protein